MTLRSGRSYQPAVAGGENPTVSADVQVSVINTDHEWVTVIHNNKNRKKSQWGKWSILERRNFVQFGDTYKTVLCEHEDPVQVQVPAPAVVQIPAPIPAPIVAPPVVQQNVAIPHLNIGHPYINPRSPSPQRENVADGNSDHSSLLPSLPTDTEFDYRSAEGGTDSSSESEEFEQTLDRSEHRNRTTPSRFNLDDSDRHTYKNVSPANSARLHSPL